MTEEAAQSPRPDAASPGGAPPPPAPPAGPGSGANPRPAGPDLGSGPAGYGPDPRAAGPGPDPAAAPPFGYGATGGAGGGGGTPPPGGPTAPGGTPPPGGPGGPPPGAAGFTSRYGLVRPRDGRYLAGVCAAIGRATNTDPVLWRVLLAVLGFFGGVGILVYIAAWLIIPGEGDSASPIESMLGRGRSSMSPVTVIVLSIVAAVGFGRPVVSEVASPTSARPASSTPRSPTTTPSSTA
ncbi:PspC domain-containing protein, partial [Micromonospora globbae]|uniref:PspC domain-containing protein n=1 Tax=Micromonospora globbae TaxID=1894969 RepID=UPI0034365694